MIDFSNNWIGFLVSVFSKGPGDAVQGLTYIISNMLLNTLKKIANLKHLENLLLLPL